MMHGTMKLQRRGAFLGAALLAASASPAAAQNLVFDGNVLFSNPTTYHAASGGAACNGGVAYSTTQLATVFFTHNRIVDPRVNAAATNLGNPRWDLQAGSPAHGRWGAPIVRASSFDPWFQDVCYAGGMDYTAGDPAKDWTLGWTYYNQSGGAGRTDINYGKPLVSVTSNLSSNTSWTNANNYELVGRIAVLPGATLNIQAGTVIFGSLSALSYLVVERGAKIVAIGTKEQPIIFTSGATPGVMAGGDWGGLLINGNAVANCSGTISPRCGLTDATHQCQSEGDATVFYGGADDNDDSGTLRYVRAEYAGHEVSPNNEINAFTFNGVGRGTTAEYLEGFKGTDDHFEWFGGSARARFLVGVDGGDDQLDWQMGYRGYVQFAVFSNAANNDKGIEADNNEFCFNVPGRSNPVICNVTFVSQLNALNSPGVHLRRGTAGTVINSIIQGFPIGLRLEHEETYANCPGAQPPLFTCDVSDAGPDANSDFVVSTGPNPSFGETSIAFRLPERGHVTVRIFDAAGRAITTLADGEFSAGEHTLPWDADGRAAGAYFYRVNAGIRSASGRLLVLR
jgi:hypothetical protein